MVRRSWSAAAAEATLGGPPGPNVGGAVIADTTVHRQPAPSAVVLGRVRVVKCPLPRPRPTWSCSIGRHAMGDTLPSCTTGGRRLR